jgi:hypothetical protein
LATEIIRKEVKMSNLKKCELCSDTDDQSEIIKDVNFYAHSYCIEDAIADSKSQDFEDRLNGFYEETPSDNGWSSEEKAYYQYGHSETHTMDGDGNVVKRKEV